MKTVLSFRSSLCRALLQLRVGNQEVEAVSMKGMEVRRRLRVCLTEVRIYLVDTRRWMRTDQRAGEQSINLSGEETHHRHLSCATIQPRLSLYVPRERRDAVRILNWSHIPASSESACCSVPSSCKKAESTACLTTHRQERSFLPLQSVDVFD